MHSPRMRQKLRWKMALVKLGCVASRMKSWLMAARSYHKARVVWHFLIEDGQQEGTEVLA